MPKSSLISDALHIVLFITTIPSLLFPNNVINVAWSSISSEIIDKLHSEEFPFLPPFEFSKSCGSERSTGLVCGGFMLCAEIPLSFLHVVL